MTPTGCKWKGEECTITTKMVCPPIYLYFRIYQKEDGTLGTYTGITTDMKRRQKEHEMGLCKTTNRFDKSYKLKEIRYILINDLNPTTIWTFTNHSFALRLEGLIKRMRINKKLDFSDKWDKWSG